MAKVLRNGEGKAFVQDAQGNVIYPCGYRGGAKQRISAPVEFNEAEVSLSSQAGISQVEKDKQEQSSDLLKCLSLATMLSEEAMDHVKKLCGAGYEVDKGGLVTPIEPESEGSSVNKGPGFFYQPFALAPGMGTDTFLGDDSSVLTEDDVATVCKAVEDDQKEIKNACFQYLLGFFKTMDEDGKGVLVGDAFKTAIGKLEEDMPMEAKDAPWMTPKAAKLIEDAGPEGTIDYQKFLLEELESPRDDAL